MKKSAKGHGKAVPAFAVRIFNLPSVIIAHGLHNGQAQSVALRFSGRPVKAVEDAAGIECALVGRVGNDERVAAKGYENFPLPPPIRLWRTAFTKRLFIMLSSSGRLAFTGRDVQRKSR